MQEDTIEGFRLSPQQRRLWFLQQDDSDSVYRVQCSLLVDGLLDKDVLELAFRQVIARHEILRTTFRSLAGMSASIQVISDSSRLALDWLDLSRLDQPEQESRVDRLLDECSRISFNPQRGPNLYATLVLLSPNRHLLVLSLPSLCADINTIKNLVSEICRCYEACLSSSELRDQPVQYADVCAVLNELLESNDSEMERRFWRNQDLSHLAAMRLAVEKPVPEVSGFAPRTTSSLIGAESILKIEALADHFQASSAALLLACWQVLLWRLTGQTNIIVGAAYDGRNFQEIEETIGLFARYLPNQSCLEEGFRFCDILNKVEESIRESCTWQDYFSWDEVNRSSAAASINFFFPFCFDFEEQPMPWSAGNLTFSIHKQYACMDRFKVRLRAIKRSDSLAVEFDYDSNCFSAPAIKRIADQFQTLLSGVIENPEAAIGDLEILSLDERRQLLVAFNDTASPYPKDKCIHHLFEEKAELSPNAIAVIFKDQRLTYSQLNARANRLAAYLQASGVKPEMFVGICLDRSPDMIIAILAILKAGGAYVPLNPAYPEDRLAFMLKDTQSPVLVTREGLLRNLPPHQSQVICLDRDRARIAEKSSENPASGTKADSIAYLIYTSGTTGVPKGVMVEHKGVVNLATWQASTFAITPLSRIAQSFSYSFDGAVGETFMALLNGAILVMLESEDLEPEALVDSINRHQVNLAVFVPSMLRQIDPNLVQRPEALTVVSVGEACPVDLALKWSRKCSFMNGYGPTEYTVYSHVWKVDHETAANLNCIPIGSPIHNTKSFILDRKLNPVPIGTVGEIYISGAGLARGYLNQPQVTFEKFIPNKLALTAEYSDLGVLSIESAGAEITEFIASRVHSDQGEGSSSEMLKESLSHEDVLKLAEGLDVDLIEATASFLNEYIGDSFLYPGFCRYLLEGVRDSFASRGINKDILSFLLSSEQLQGLKGVDLGFGNAEVMQILSAAGASMKGFDLSPFFVQHARTKGLDACMAKVDDKLETFAINCRLAEGSQDFAISTMVLDRVANPRNLLKNLFFVLKPSGRFAIQTILPIVPVDDGSVDNPITYTSEQNRISSGESVERDKLELISLLYEFGAGSVCVRQMPYVTSSRDGIQHYRLWSFFGSKRADQAPAFEAEYSRLYRTGDLGRYLPDGNIEFLGRVDNQVKLRGFRIELGEIEDVLRRHASVNDAVVAMSEDDAGNKRLVGYVVAEADAVPSVNELRRFLGAQMPEFMVPAAYVILDSLPLTTNGKVDRKALPSPDQRRPELERAFEAPVTPAEKQLAKLWAQFLRVEKVGIHDNFFQLGGDSILAIQIVAKANQAGLHLTPRQMFKYQTISGLGALVEAASSAQVDRGPAAGQMPLTPIQHWFFERELPDPNHFNFALLLEAPSSLDPVLLQRAVQHLVTHHDGLRLRFERSEAGWRQYYAELDEEVPFRTVDLSALPEAEQRPNIEAVANELQTNLNISEGPIMRVAFFSLGEGRPARLLIIIHHLVVDVISWGIMLEDLYATYLQLSRGQSIEVPPRTTFLKEWAERLTEYAQSPELLRELDYWLAEPRRRIRRLPIDYPGGANSEASARTVTVSLGVDETRALLREVPKAYRTQVHEVLLTGLAQAYEEWSGEKSLLVDLEGHGREELFDDLDLSRTVGWFTAIFPVLLDLTKADGLGEALKAVKEQIRRIPNGGIGHGLLRHLSSDTEPAAQLRSLPQAEVLFNYLGQLDQAMPEASLFRLAHESHGQSHSLRAVRSHLLEINGGIAEDRLRLDWGYSENVHDRSTIQNLANGFIEALIALIGHCRSLKAGDYTPSDFPHAKLDQQKLDGLLNKVKFEE